MGHYIFVVGENGVIARYTEADPPPEGAVVLSEEEAQRRQGEIEQAHYAAVAREHAAAGRVWLGALGSLFSKKKVSAAEASALGARSSLSEN